MYRKKQNSVSRWLTMPDIKKMSSCSEHFSSIFRVHTTTAEFPLINDYSRHTRTRTKESGEGEGEGEAEAEADS